VFNANPKWCISRKILPRIELCCKGSRGPKTK